jgi:hypothetical protein
MDRTIMEATLLGIFGPIQSGPGDFLPDKLFIEAVGSYLST